MDKFGDPGFRYHRTLAQLWALVTFELADTKLIPFDLKVYADAVNNYVDDLEGYAKSKGADRPILDLTALHGAADEFTKNAAKFQLWGKTWEHALENEGFESSEMAVQRMSHNSRMATFETNLLDVGGGVSYAQSYGIFICYQSDKDNVQLAGREQFVHVLFAPQAWSGYDEAYFPGIRDAIDVDDWKSAQTQVHKIAAIITYASRKLND